MAVDTNAIANELFAAIEVGDLDSVIDLYHPDARIWHSWDEVHTNREQNRELLKAFVAKVSDRKYEVVNRHFFDGGLVQEHVVHGRFANGSIFRIPVCFLCHIDQDGKIVRIAEYVSPSSEHLALMAE